ncbi:MAG: homocysteine S-methyltransferase family protein [Nitrospirae bacterium]|nr:homocysteine S-methyltransferase family protein [Nitrospirota bacterium]
MSRLLELINTRPLVLDGAMGTMLQEAGMAPGDCPEGLNTANPDMVVGVHRKYVDAGADIITTNSFGGSRIKLAEYGLDGRLAELNAAAVALARKAAESAGREIFVAADIGPTGKFLEPVGSMTFDECYDVFAEQVKAIADAGPDCILIETMSDIKEARAAVIAAKENSSLPVLITMTFQQDLRTLLGTPPEAAIAVLEAAGADMIGANCSLGPEGVYEVARAMAAVARVPLIFQPNAGLPRLVDGKTVYPATPAELADFAEKFFDLGVGVIGSCCGSRPEHTRAVAERLKARGGRKLPVRTTTGVTTLASRTKAVELGTGRMPVIIGERINPTGRKDLTAELTAGRTAMVKKEAKGQAEAGAALVDINVGLAGGDEVALMPLVLRAVEEATDLPVVIDSTDPAAIEAALRETGGKPLVNSVTGDRDRLDAILPLVKRYGAAVVGLTIDEAGVPDTAKKRVAIAKRILDACLAHGIPKEDLIIDALVLTASAEQSQAVETLRAVSMIKGELGLNTSLGVSNISFGLPSRPLVNASYLTMALGHGLDAAMVNPYDTRITEAMSAGAVLTGRDPRAEGYIKAFKGKAKGAEPKKSAADQPPLTLEEKLRQAIIDGDKENVVPLVEEALAAGMEPLAIGNGCLIPALTEVGKLYEAKEFFLPQVMQSAETMKAAFARLKQDMKPGAGGEHGTVVLATVFGDVHDIGKNILSTLLENHGLRVIDLGKNVAKDAILDAAEREKADVIGLSALMTTTMTQMAEVIAERDRRGMKTPVVLGGAVVTEEYAEKVGAAGSSRDALEAVGIFKRLIGR